MKERARRKELLARYRQMRPAAGVYRIFNNQNNKALLGSTANLTSIRSKLEFAKTSNNPGVLDWRLSKDIREFGIDAFAAPRASEASPGARLRRRFRRRT